MNKYIVKSVEQRHNYQILTITPKNQNHELDFEPGQYATIGFMSGGRPTPMRCFSFVGSPRDSDLQFSMRSNGRFTSKVAKLQPGDRVNVQGPFGDFVIEPQNDRNIVMVAAGIGITPFMSMLRWATETRLPNPITLLYANRNQDEIPFADEILELASANPNLRVVFAIDKGTNDPARKIYSGRIDAELLQKATGQNLRHSTYFICGPQPFMDKVSNALKDHQVDDTRIITESFSEGSTFSWNFKRLTITSMTYALAAIAITVVAGIVGITDLIHYVPKATAATRSQTNTTTQTLTPTTPATNTVQTNTPTTPTTTASPSTTNYPAPSTSQSYQQPVSTVS